MTNNWLSAGFKLLGSVAAEFNYVAKPGENPPFVDAAKRDFHLKSPNTSITAAGVPWSKIALPARIGTPDAKPPALQEYKAPLAVQDRPGFKPDAKADLGAFGFEQK